jgi:hypothetical protein
MNKFYGTIGFEKTEETSPGVWKAQTVERGYCGDLIRNIGRYGSDNKVNSDYSINSQVSVVCDPYALENFQFIKFVRFLGSAWKVSSVEINYPRLILNLGEVYKEEVENEE